MLRAFGKFLATRIRNEDVVCRYGGEEFALILPETTPEAALEVTDRLRQQFPEVRIDDRGGGYATATFSAGVASFPVDGRSAAELLRAADRALYTAKMSGRNQVQLSPHGALERVTERVA
jgi:diguanylate cyclase (GGDEF)-like protein